MKALVIALLLTVSAMVSATTAHGQPPPAAPQQPTAPMPSAPTPVAPQPLPTAAQQPTAPSPSVPTSSAPKPLPDLAPAPASPTPTSSTPLGSAAGSGFGSGLPGTTGMGSGMGSGMASAAGSAVELGSAADGAAAPDETEGATTQETKENTLFAIKVIAGLVLLLALAYLGGHRRVVRFQEKLGISGVITAGFPFVALGVIASDPSIGILSDDVIDGLRPLLHFGLGWLGFIIGAQFDIRVLDRVPKGTAYLILVEALGPFAITAAGCGAMMLAFGMSISDSATWRDMILLGIAAAMTAPRKFRGFANRRWHEGQGVDVLLGQLDDLVGVIGLVFITAYFRDDVGGAWQLPETAWVFVSLGLGVAIGVLIFAMIRVPVSNAEFLAVMLGGIAFAAGLAGYLRLSPIAICFIAGVLVTNFPNDQRESVYRILHHLERPVYLLFLMIAGAVWTVTDWRGWVLVPLFVAGRVLGKWTGVMAARTAVGALLPANFAEQRNWVTPLSGFAVAIVVSAQTRYHDEGLPWIMTAVIGGAVLTELLVSRSGDVEPSTSLDDLDPHDELADLDREHEVPDAPIHRDEPPPPSKPGGHEP